MKRSLSILAILLLLLGCNAPNEGSAQAQNSSQGAPQDSDGPSTSPTAIRTELEGEPALGAAKIRVYVLENNEGVSGATVEVTGDMTHAGMAPVTATAQEVGAGLYETEDFAFTMAGDWLITSEVVYPDGTEEEDTTALSVPGQ